MKVLLLVCLYTLPALICANPLSEEREDTPFSVSLKSFLRVRRQSPSFTCNMDSDCTNQTDVPSELVQCTNGVCECNDCFQMAGDGRCSSTICPDFPYNSVNNQCGNDNRPTQLTAFLLTIFLSSTGAGNFYIGQNGLGGGQIALLVIILVFSYCMCCFPCCLACCMDDVKGSIVFIILMLVAAILVIIASLCVSAWYIADVIIFATNQRLAGNGCILSPWG